MIPHLEDVILEVKGIPDSVVYLADTVSVETAPVKVGPVSSRTLLFKDADGNVTASVPTFFTANQGAQAEPLAMELAEAVGLQFHSTLEPWEYDKEQRKQHQKELAMAEKNQRKARLQALKNRILRRAQTEEPVCISSEDEMSVTGNPEQYESDGINYDALDDEK